MAKKSLICVLAIIIFSFCCGFCFAEENGNSINLGNEIMKSIDKTGDSIDNVVSGNIVGDTANTLRDGVDDVGNGVRDMGNDMNGMTGNDNNRNNDDKNNNNNQMTADGNYNAQRTATEGTVANAGSNTMTATTWMWIILIVAAVIIIAAIWYYATQNNS